MCHRRQPNLSRLRTAVIYADPITSAIHALKYQQRFAAGDLLGDLLHQGWGQWQTEVDIVVPVPLHAERRQSRGYNQAALIARRFAEHIDRPVEEAALVRTRATRPQVGLSMDERLDNVRHAFAANRNVVAGKRVLLIDDVCTTGATLHAAADALAEADSAEISAYCVARAVGDRWKT